MPVINIMKVSDPIADLHRKINTEAQEARLSVEQHSSIILAIHETLHDFYSGVEDPPSNYTNVHRYSMEVLLYDDSLHTQKELTKALLKAFRALPNIKTEMKTTESIEQTRRMRTFIFRNPDEISFYYCFKLEFILGTHCKIVDTGEVEIIEKPIRKIVCEEEENG